MLHVLEHQLFESTTLVIPGKMVTATPSFGDGRRILLDLWHPLRFDQVLKYPDLVVLVIPVDRQPSQVRVRMDQDRVYKLGS
jgi:hypothetical protein